MILRKLTTNRLIIVDYFNKGLLQTSKGYVCNLDLNDQILSLKDEQQRVYFIRLSGIKEIH
jgi:hypothetical protein